MPKTPVDEDHAHAGAEDQVWLSGEGLVVEAKAITHRVDKATNLKLGRGVLASNAAHVLRAAGGIKEVHKAFCCGCHSRGTCPCYLFAMEEAELTRLGFRKGLDKQHRDFELVTRLDEAIIRHAKGWEKFIVDVPALLRQSIDEVIDASRSRRLVIDELEKTEKTYLGTKVEILLRNHLNLDRGKVLDVLIDGIEVDIKNTVKSGWMIPRESMGHPCILISTDEKRAKCSFGLVVIEQDILTPGKNQDGKRSISAEGRKNVHWMLKDKDYPRNFWEGVPPEALRDITKPKGGTERLALLFKRYQGVPICRDVLLALAHQKDAMKRLRKNGGARDRLAKEGIGLLSGKYHATLIAKLGLPHCGVNDFISIRAVKVEDIDMLRKAEIL